VELAALASQPTPAAPAPVAAPDRPQSLRILLVEDNADTLNVLSRLLRRWGCGVTCAQSVQAALECAAKERFDLLVSDIGLPDGSGLEIMQQLKQDYGLRGIAISGYGMDEDVKQSLKAGFEKHLTKPLSLDVLRAAVCEAVAS
jgi:CheY-like chemotaxis protein